MLAIRALPITVTLIYSDSENSAKKRITAKSVRRTFVEHIAAFA